MKNLFLLFFFLLIHYTSAAQTQPFELILEPIEIAELGGVQSYAFGTHDGKWLIVGGRLDGLHRRQPWATFDEIGHNTQLIVIDPEARKRWAEPMVLLPIEVQEQLSSTNMEFYQDGDILYCIGGYGYSKVQGQHTTYAKITAIDVPGMIAAIMDNSDIAPFIRQYSAPELQVSGGKLKKINEVYHLLGGQLFIGAYNPMGPNNGPGFQQEYTNAIKRFTIEDDGQNLTINYLEPFVDEDHLHRRDYNAEPQILSNGQQAITLFSGVFQKNVDLPFLDAVTVDANDYEVHSEFQQLFNHYHCPALPLFAESTQEMHTVFFGGIAQYYMDGEDIVQDDNVPFVTTIARVSRNASNQMQEVVMPINMPGLLGAGAEFIPNLTLPHFDNKVFKLDSIGQEPTHIGYIFGGINSSQPNIFFINDGTQSIASPVIYKVSIVNNSVSTSIKSELKSGQALQLQIFPNPINDSIAFSFQLENRQTVQYTISDLQGQLVRTMELGTLNGGKHHFTSNLKSEIGTGTFIFTLQTNDGMVSRKIIIQ